MRLIDADALDLGHCRGGGVGGVMFANLSDISDAIKAAPTIDPIHAAGGCRCGECKNRTWYAPEYGCGNSKAPWYRQDDDMPVLTKPDDFCSYGEPREVQDDG